MSHQVDLTKKLNTEDRAYLLARGRRHLVLQNDRRFSSSSPSAPQGATDEQEGSEEFTWEDEVKELNVEELRDALSERDLATTGNKAELQKRLIEAGPETD